MVKVTFLGHAAFQLEDGDYTLLIDPFFTGNGQTPFKAADFKKVDYILVTHGHGDHVGDTVEIAGRTGATAIANAEVSGWLSGRGVKVHAMHIGGDFRFPFGRVKLTPAFHGSSINDGGKPFDGGFPCGFLVTLKGKTIYHSGDTALMLEMKLLEDEKVDVALLPIGGNYTMGIDDAVKAVSFIKPKITVPMHYDTFDVIKADPKDFAAKAAALTSVKVLKPGESLEL
ncbi:MAG: metal-dependent hydrolase [Synergistaceae bacterium]|jgi:L-ascorbate metabolism protein UlaG (beta-lactamase superfamily)|nr:metal-dependent hydrolase [Synergistaceae bacterium]